ncbi:MAG TPA: hypothetical protein VIS52_08485 [Motiliproteus sp.]
MWLVLLCSACTTLRPIPGEPDQLRAQIQRGELVEVGDRVVIATNAGLLHQFNVIEITADEIIGAEDRVELASLQSLGIREPTALGYIGGVALGGLVATAIHAMVLGLVTILAW